MRGRSTAQMTPQASREVEQASPHYWQNFLAGAWIGDWILVEPEERGGQHSVQRVEVLTLLYAEY